MVTSAGKREVTIVETSPRDGLSHVKKITTSDKIHFINKLSETGIEKIDSVSFTHPALYPKYADAEEVTKGIKKMHDVIYSGMAPNEIGCRRAVITKIDEISFLINVSDDYNRNNSLKTLRETLNKIPIICEMAVSNGKAVRAYILCAFGCPYAGKIPAEDVIQLVIKLSHLGANEISLLDSTGMANPRQVKSLLKTIIDLKLPSQIAVHFHNTRNAAMVNCIAAYEVGVRIFDTAIGGLSWPLYGPIEADFGYWNVPTEDLAYLFEEMGVRTGINMDRLLKCVELAEKLSGRPLHGHLLNARSYSQYTKVYNDPLTNM